MTLVTHGDCFIEHLSSFGAEALNYCFFDGYVNPELK